jgi:hypothetical protein
LDYSSELAEVTEVEETVLLELDELGGEPLEGDSLSGGCAGSG